MTRPLLSALSALFVAVGGCVSTTTLQISPSPQQPVCAPSATATVLWRPKWRADQKDAPDREAAAAAGLVGFFEKSGCFKSAALQRLAQDADQDTQAVITEAAKRTQKVVLITVRELGPTVKIGASLALVEGATEVVLDVSEFTPQSAAPRQYTIQWRNGGPGVVKGVASLPQDMQSALAAGLRPPAP